MSESEDANGTRILALVRPGTSEASSGRFHEGRLAREPPPQDGVPVLEQPRDEPPDQAGQKLRLEGEPVREHGSAVTRSEGALVPPPLHRQRRRFFDEPSTDIHTGQCELHAVDREEPEKEHPAVEQPLARYDVSGKKSARRPRNGHPHHRRELRRYTFDRRHPAPRLGGCDGKTGLENQRIFGHATFPERFVCARRELHSEEPCAARISGKRPREPVAARVFRERLPLAFRSAVEPRHEAQAAAKGRHISPPALRHRTLAGASSACARTASRRRARWPSMRRAG